MTGCRHEWLSESRNAPYVRCGKCNVPKMAAYATGWEDAIRLAAADIAARDAVIVGLERKIRALASMIPPMTPEEAQREWDSFDGPVEPMSEEEIGRIVDEVMNRVARSKGKVQG